MIMVRKSLGQKLPVFAATLFVASVFSIVTNPPSYAENNKFFCTQESGVPVTKVRTTRGDETFIRWVVEDFKKFPPLTRCRSVTAKFQRYYDNGQLFITSRDNFQGYPVLCIANRKGTPCTSANILVTLKPGSDTGRILKQMLDFRRGVGASPINLSGSQHITYDNGDLYLDVKGLVDEDTIPSNQPNSQNTPKKQPVEPRF
jgi:hypothetical protein